MEPCRSRTEMVRFAAEAEARCRQTTANNSTWMNALLFVNQERVWGENALLIAQSSDMPCSFFGEILHCFLLTIIKATYRVPVRTLHYNTRTHKMTYICMCKYIRTHTHTHGCPLIRAWGRSDVRVLGQ